MSTKKREARSNQLKIARGRASDQGSQHRLGHLKLTNFLWMQVLKDIKRRSCSTNMGKSE